MADIILECSECGAENTVSEYVDPELAKCNKCGNPLEVPYLHIAQARKGGDQKKPRSQHEPVAVNVFHREGEIVEATYKKSKKRKRHRELRVWTPNKWTLLAMFVVITSILSALRWLPILDDVSLEAYKKFGIMAVGVMWIVVIVDAFNDNVMHGLLSLFIPPYSLWYLYTQSDSYVLRLAFGVLILPFGFDVAIAAWNLVGGGLQWLSEDHISDDF